MQILAPYIPHYSSQYKSSPRQFITDFACIEKYRGWDTESLYHLQRLAIRDDLHADGSINNQKSVYIYTIKSCDTEEELVVHADLLGLKIVDGKQFQKIGSFEERKANGYAIDQIRS